MTEADRDRFDVLVEEVLAGLPPGFGRFLEEVPLVVLDRPTPEILGSLGVPPDDVAASEEICGLHSGVSRTEQSVEHSGGLPSQIHLFRAGIVAIAGGWEHLDADSRVYEQIRITLLHEIGHEMGLEEDDLEDLGYG